MIVPELLDSVLDPERLRAKLADLEHQAREHGAELGAGGDLERLPEGHLARLQNEIAGEQHDSRRVARALTPPGPGGPPAPPPVVYLSNSPTVGQFMSVITTCFESELRSPSLDHLLHLDSLDDLWRDLRRWTEDLRSRFRRFGPCDIRFIEPKLAQALADLEGRHRFATSPATVALGDQARVFAVGDWATALPQARNVAAQIADQLHQVPAGLDCHVIHLGDTYYSGFEDECRRRFLDLWPVAAGGQAGSWTLAGNHDMYSGGHGYFDVLLADSRFAGQAGCSYFALENEHWQILGLDSAYHDPDLADLQAPQADWLGERVARAGRRGTMLLSHHQPYSAYERVSTPLAETVAAALGAHGPVDAWLWGHEHRCAVYAPEGGTVSRGLAARYSALVGHGGVPQLLSDPDQPDPAAGALDWALTDYYEVGDDRWGLGGFAVLSFDGPALEIQYYDEYGSPARIGPALGRSSQAATLVDERPVRPPDRLVAGAAR